MSEESVQISSESPSGPQTLKGCSVASRATPFWEVSKTKICE